MAALERDTEIQLLDETSKDALNQMIGSIGLDIFAGILTRGN